MAKQGSFGTVTLDGRIGWGMIVLSNALAVLPVVFMAMGVQECAFRVKAGLRLIDPKDAHNTAILLISAILLPFGLYLIYFVNLGKTVKQAERAVMSLLIIAAGYLAYSVYTVYGLFVLNDMWLVSGDNPGSFSCAVVPLFLCGCLSFGTIYRWRMIVGSARQQYLVCQICGYSLTGFTEARCPQCGTPFDRNLLVGQLQPSPQRETAGQSPMVELADEKGEVEGPNDMS